MASEPAPYDGTEIRVHVEADGDFDPNSDGEKALLYQVQQRFLEALRNKAWVEQRGAYTVMSNDLTRTKPQAIRMIKLVVHFDGR